MWQIIKRFSLTVLNCLSLRSFKYFKILYVEFPHDVFLIDTNAYEIWHSKNDKSYWINISKFEKNLNRNTGLLHEIGHYIDYKKQSISTWDYINNSNKEKHREKQAWKWAIRLSKQYDIPICAKTARKWLSSYGAEYAVLNNMVRNK